MFNIKYDSYDNDYHVKVLYTTVWCCKGNLNLESTICKILISFKG